LKKNEEEIRNDCWGRIMKKKFLFSLLGVLGFGMEEIQMKKI